ncbi:hypothetical protein AAHE18_17G030400 [Arachis hypogaea]
MASALDSWVKEYNEAVKLGDDITAMMSGRNSVPSSGPETQRHTSAIRRKITILGTRLDSLQSLLSKLPAKQAIDLLLGPETKPDAMSRTTGLDNNQLVGFQRQIMKEQDNGLAKLEETVLSTKHIALAVNEELDLHTRLIDDLDQHVDVTNSRMRWVQKKLSIVNKRTKGGCSCWCLLLSVVGIVGLLLVIWILLVHL